MGGGGQERGRKQKNWQITICHGKLLDAVIKDVKIVHIEKFKVISQADVSL